MYCKNSMCVFSVFWNQYNANRKKIAESQTRGFWQYYETKWKMLQRIWVLIQLFNLFQKRRQSIETTVYKHISQHFTLHLIEKSVSCTSGLPSQFCNSFGYTKLTSGFPSDQRKSPSMVLSLRPVHWYSLYLSVEESLDVSHTANAWLSSCFPGLKTILPITLASKELFGIIKHWWLLADRMDGFW